MLLTLVVQLSGELLAEPGNPLCLLLTVRNCSSTGSFMYSDALMLEVSIQQVKFSMIPETANCYSSSVMLYIFRRPRETSYFCKLLLFISEHKP